jgi:hypothetical protein
MTWRGVLGPGMRAYYIPLVAGLSLAVSTFLPWVVLGELRLRGFPDTAALWALGLGLTASLLAALSLITRKNSRHPLLVVGLVALGITFLSWRLMPRAAADRALTRSQAVAIVDHTEVGPAPPATAGIGIFLGMAASIVIVGFGLTIVMRRVARPYVSDPDDDVE